MVTRGLTKRRQVRLLASHDEALARIASRRGCDVVDLFREAIIEHFNLPTDANQIFVTQEIDATAEGEQG